MLLHEELTNAIIGAAIKVHRALGPGLLESVYESCLAHELSKLGLEVERQAPLPVIYDGVLIDCGFKIDLWVERKVVVELKVAEKPHPIHEAQLFTYMRLSKTQVGLLLNFNVQSMRHGIIRRVLSDLGSPSA